jgi:hypothetical protein
MANHQMDVLPRILRELIYRSINCLHLSATTQKKLQHRRPEQSTSIGAVPLFFVPPRIQFASALLSAHMEDY